ncbi:MAG TPA: hypothetical protein VJ792_00760 [Candidatus Nitrosotalea sp.]|nr:hypothetical protein [Candidatus Nitrosotalea sp.]
MERKAGIEVSLDEMWNVIERFGIRRETYELSKPTIQEIRNLYLAILEKQKLFKSAG